MEQLGKTGYEAYCKSTGGKSLVSGDPLPSWRQLKAEIRAAWTDAAVAIAKECKEIIICENCDEEFADVLIRRTDDDVDLCPECWKVCIEEDAQAEKESEPTT